MECFICGINGENAVIFSAIVNEGVVPVCEDCSLKEDILIIKRVGQLRESERNQTVYERLSRMAGLDPVGHKEKIVREERIELKRQERRKPAGPIGVSQRDDTAVPSSGVKKDLSFPNLRQIKPQFEQGLVRNYHWTILNARRAMKLTQKQLADEIGEPEASVKLVERGILPDNYPPFIRKLQTYLRVNLFDNQLKKDLDLNKSTPKAIHVEEEAKTPYWKRLGFLQKNKEKRKNQELEQKENKNQETNEIKKLSQDEIDRITFER